MICISILLRTFKSILTNSMTCFYVGYTNWKVKEFYTDLLGIPSVVKSYYDTFNSCDQLFVIRYTIVETGSDLYV